jgi:hypothetical protein
MMAETSSVTGSEPSDAGHTTTLPYDEVESTVTEWLEELKQNRPNWYPFVLNVQNVLEPELFSLLRERDGAALLSRELPKTYSPQKVAEPGSAEQKGWELAGLFYRNQRRYYEALPIFAGLYEHILVAQEQEDQRFHKGMPLVWISDCYRDMGFPVLGKRYLMLALCEDAIRDKGVV